MENKPPGYDSSQFFREDTLERIKQLEIEIAESIERLKRFEQQTQDTPDDDLDCE